MWGQQQQQEETCSANPGQPCELEVSERSGDLVCRNCGVVSARVYDAHLEKRLFGEVGDEARKRADVGDAGDDSLATGVGGAVFRPTGAADFRPGVVARAGPGAPSRRLAAALSAKSRAAADAEERLSRLCEAVRLPGRIAQTCRNVYRELCAARELKSRTARGCRTDAVLAGVLYTACKIDSSARSFREISRDTGVSQQDIRQGYKLVVQTLPQVRLQAERTTPAALVARVCEELHLPFAVVRSASDIAERAAPFVEGRQPGSVAAAALSVVMRGLDGDLQRSDAQIAEAAGVTPSTIRLVAEIIRAHWDEITSAVHPAPQ